MSELRDGLRPYQQEAVAAIIGGLRRGGRGQLRAACGTGKTRIAAQAAAGLGGGGVIVVLVPSIALAAQTLAAWPAGCPVDAAFAVCSDATVSGGTRAGDLAVPVSTDPETLAKWLANASGRTLVVATYDSAGRLDEAVRRAGAQLAVVVCDEAHRTAGRADKRAAAVLRPGFLPGRRLYMTATPRIGTGVRADGELAAWSMDDQSVYGPVLYDYPFGRAIGEGYLKDYRLVAAAVTDAEVADLLAGDDRGLAEDGVPVRMAAAQAALAMAAAEHGLRRCVAFVPRVADARLFAATLSRTLALLPPGRRPAGPVSAGFVHGEMTSRQRDEELDRLRCPPAGGWAVVANARCLGEGIDIPAIDSVLFAAPKESVTDIAQAAGRALRRHGDAATATIIVPALLPGEGTQEPGDDGRWEPVLNVVRALAAHDEALTAELGKARARRAEGAGAGLDGPDLPGRISVAAPPGTVSKTVEALRLRIIDGAASRWWDGYGHARAYHARHGHLNVPFGYVTGSGFRLGQWLSWQRTSRSQGKLTAERTGLLEALGIIWDQAEAAWQRAYASLAAFAREHGHFEVPPGHQTPDGTGLATFGHNQRKARADGTITPGRAALLEQIGFPWDAAEARWERRYQQLAEAVARCGGARNLPAGSYEAVWLQAQHNAFRRGRLPGRKITLLEQAGIRLRPLDSWAEGCQALAALKAVNGNLRIPAGYTTPGGLKLVNWASRQRALWKAGQLTPAQARQLTELGFTPDAGTSTWHARYTEAATWKHQHGHLVFPASHPLRYWLYTQRKKHHAGKLPDDRAALLHNIGALTDPEPDNTARP